MEEKLKAITEDLQELNNPQKISCIGAAMVNMPVESIIDLLNGLKETAKKIFTSELNIEKQEYSRAQGIIDQSKSNQQRLTGYIEKL